MLKTGEADIGYLMVGVEAATIKADPRLRLAQTIPPATWWLEFPEQWNPKSPWHDRRVRLAATLALDKQTINEAERLGFSRLTGSIIPSGMEFALKLEPFPYDAAQAKRLLTEAGYPSGFDAGDLTPLPPFTTFGEALTNALAAVGIVTRVHAMERATFMEAWRGKKLSGVIATVSAAPGGNAATRIEGFVLSSAPYASGGYPDIDDLFRQQARAERVGHGVRDGGRCRQRAAFTGALDAEGVQRRGRDHVVHLEMRHVGSARQRVVHERARHELTGPVVDDFLEERVPDAVSDAAVHLSLDDHRVDHGAAVVHGDVAENRDESGLGIDLHHR